MYMLSQQIACKYPMCQSLPAGLGSQHWCQQLLSQETGGHIELCTDPACGLSGSTGNATLNAWLQPYSILLWRPLNMPCVLHMQAVDLCTMSMYS